MFLCIIYLFISDIFGSTHSALSSSHPKKARLFFRTQETRPCRSYRMSLLKIQCCFCVVFDPTYEDIVSSDEPAVFWHICKQSNSSLRSERGSLLHCYIFYFSERNQSFVICENECEKVRILGFSIDQRSIVDRLAFRWGVEVTNVILFFKSMAGLGFLNILWCLLNG